MPFRTITYNGTEKTLADWGLINFKRHTINQARDAVSFRHESAATDATPIFPDKSTLTFRRGRNMDSAGNFSGGSIVFTGLVIQIPRHGSTKDENHNYICAGPGWYLETLPFEHTYNIVTDNSDPLNPVYDTQTSGHLFLNMSIAPGSFGKLTTGQQITEVLNWVLAQFGTNPKPFQIGTISPALDIPIDEIRDVNCMEVIHKEMRWSPDAVLFFDYTTDPPTLHVKDRTNLTTVDLPITAGVLVNSVDINPRYDLRANYVKIRYEISSTINGSNFLDIVEDYWPHPLPTTPIDKFSGLSLTFNLQGTNANTTSADVTIEAIANTGAGAPAKTWWEKHHPSLTTDSANPVASYTIVADSDTRVTLDGNTDLNLTNELITGQLASWMGVQSQRIRVGCKVNLVRKNGHKENNVPIFADLVATNATTRGYTTVAESQQAEPVPTGLAHFLFNAVNPLQYEGSLLLQEEDCTGQVSVGNLLNLTGSAQSAWDTMAALVQKIEEDWDNGTTLVSFGPAGHLSLGELIDLLRISRARQIRSSYGMRSGGATSNSAGNITLGSKTPEKNSTHVEGFPTVHVTSETIDGKSGITIKTDATAGQFAMQSRDAAGAVDTTKPQAVVTLSDVSTIADAVDITPVDGTTPGLPTLVKAREVELCIGGVKRYAIILVGGIYTKDDEGTTIPCGGSGGMNYRGTYVNGTTYNKYDVVRKQSGDSQGVWICVADGLLAGVDPVWPEPGGTWELLAFGVQATAVCAGGTKTVYFNALPPS